MLEIQQARYPAAGWNIYGAQASDGDNWHHDSKRCRELLEQRILPACRHYAYVQVAEPEQNLWEEYLAYRYINVNYEHRHDLNVQDGVMIGMQLTF